MPNFQDSDRLGTTLNDAKIVNMEEYKAQAVIKNATATDASVPAKVQINVTTWIMVIVVAIFFYFFARR